MSGDTLAQFLKLCHNRLIEINKGVRPRFIYISSKNLVTSDDLRMEEDINAYKDGYFSFALGNVNSLNCRFYENLQQGKIGSKHILNYEIDSPWLSVKDKRMSLDDGYDWVISCIEKYKKNDINAEVAIQQWMIELI